MDFRLTPEQAAFKQEIDDFIAGLSKFEGNDPEENSEHNKLVRSELTKRKWLAMPWPEEYGGLAATPVQQMLFNEITSYERIANGGMGVSWVGPALILYGTDEQKERFLPRITDASDWWCTFYSEPGSGSDLASLQTRAVRDGDEYVISGQKIWTSGAHESSWGWLAARTDPEAPKHRGISMFLVELDSPGLEVRPLINMAGKHEFNEVFFDDVRIPATQLVGEENRGWYTLAVALDFERSSIGSTSGARRTLDDFLDRVRANQIVLKATDRNRLADCHIATEVLRFVGYRIAAEQERTGIAPTQLSQMAKLSAMELNQKITGMTMCAGGMEAQGHASGSMWDGYRYEFLRSVANTIEGGTSEIQRNVIATRGLGLPRG